MKNIYLIDLMVPRARFMSSILAYFHFLFYLVVSTMRSEQIDSVDLRQKRLGFEGEHDDDDDEKVASVILTRERKQMNDR